MVTNIHCEIYLCLYATGPIVLFVCFFLFSSSLPPSLPLLGSSFYLQQDVSKWNDQMGGFSNLFYWGHGEHLQVIKIISVYILALYIHLHLLGTVFECIQNFRGQHNNHPHANNHHPTQFSMFASLISSLSSCLWEYLKTQ